MKKIQVNLFLLTPLVILSSSSFAEEPLKMHFSERGTTPRAESPRDLLDTVDDKSTQKIYIDKSSKNELNPDDLKDVEKLANSVEIEFYKISEGKSSHTVVESKSGICYGFKSKTGAALTDSTTYYLDKDLQDYYTGIVGATVQAKDAPKDVIYSPVFYIRDEKLSKKIQKEEKEKRESLIQKNLDEKTEVLNKIICK